MPKTSIQLSARPKVPFRELQRRAQELYDCLSRYQACKCSTAHSIGIGPYLGFDAETKKGAALNLLLGTQAGTHGVQLQVCFSSTQQPVQPSKEEQAARVQAEAAATLKRDLAVKMQQSLASKAGKKKRISALAATSLSIGIIPETDLTRDRSILKRATQKLQKPSARARLTVAFSSRHPSKLSQISESTSVTSAGTTATSISSQYTR